MCIYIYVYIYICIHMCMYMYKTTMTNHICLNFESYAFMIFYANAIDMSSQLLSQMRLCIRCRQVSMSCQPTCAKLKTQENLGRLLHAHLYTSTLVRFPRCSRCSKSFDIVFACLCMSLHVFACLCRKQYLQDQNLPRARRNLRLPSGSTSPRSGN